MNLEKFKDALEIKKAELVSRIESLRKDKFRSGGAISADFEEQAVDIENDEVVDHLESLEVKELEQINSALARIENGQFGICLACGEEISEKRLQAVPHSPICISCAN